MSEEKPNNKNYDYTSGARKKRRTERIAASLLCERLVLMDPTDAIAIRAYAKKLYTAKGKSLCK